MTRPAHFAAALLLALPAAQASNCEQIRDSIDAKVRAAGVKAFTLTIVDAAASAPGRNVGSCDRGSKKILYVAGGATAPAPSAAPAPAPAAKPAAGVLTECRDGSVKVGGDCKR